MTHYEEEKRTKNKEKEEKKGNYYKPDHISEERVLSEEEKAEFLEYCRIAGRIDYTYDELVLAHIKERGWTFENMAKETGLNEQYFKNLGKPGSTWKSCVISIAFGLRLSLFDTITLLASAGMCFKSTSMLDRAYMLLIESYSNCSVDQANALLSQLGFKGKQLLGSQTIVKGTKQRGNG